MEYKAQDEGDATFIRKHSTSSHKIRKQLSITFMKKSFKCYQRGYRKAEQDALFRRLHLVDTTM